MPRFLGSLPASCPRYNALNGVPSCLRGDLQNGLLRSKWGYDGLIVSDQDSIKDAWAGQKQNPGHFYGRSFENVTALGIRAGCDLNDGNTYASYCQAAIAKGLLAEEDVDRALSRVLLQRFRVGAFDPKARVPYRSITTDVLDSPAHRELALASAREAVVLLENNDHTLPLPKRWKEEDNGDEKTTMKNSPMVVALVGPMANNTAVMMGGKPDYHSSFTVSILEGVRRKAAALGGAAAVSVAYAQGSGVSGDIDPGAVEVAAQVAARADYTVVCVGIDASIEHEGEDRTSIGLPPAQAHLMARVVAAVNEAGKGRVIVALVNGGPVSSDWLRNASLPAPAVVGPAAIGPRNPTPTAAAPPAPRVHAVVEVFDLGQSAGTAVADVLWGDSNPSGALPFTIYPEAFVDMVPLTNMSMRPAAGVNPGRTYRYFQGTPLWPFGHSRSFTTFDVAWTNRTGRRSLTLSTGRADELELTAVVTNTGRVAGGKIVHAFISRLPGTWGADARRDTSAGGQGPTLSLWGLKKVHLSPGERATVTFAASEHDWCPFCAVDDDGHRAVNPGIYRLRLGGNGLADGGADCRQGAGSACATTEVRLVGESIYRPL